MLQNPSIPVVSQLLASGEASGSLAPILFDHYRALTSERERTDFVVALIGEVLVARAFYGLSFSSSAQNASFVA